MNLNLVNTTTTQDNRGKDLSGSRVLTGVDNMAANQEFTVPAELQELLLDFTVHYLVTQPPDIVDFAVQYFSSLQNRRENGKMNSEDEIMESEEDFEDDETVYGNAGNRRKSVFAEAYNPEEDDGVDEVKTVHPKTDDQRQRLAEAVKDCLLFRSLDSEQLIEVLDAMFERKAEPGETIITQGADGDNFYVVDHGIYNVLVDIPDGSKKKVMNYEGKGSFGELALLYNMPRAATVQAETTGALWAMDRQTFRKIVLRNAYQKRKLYEAFLKNVPLLSHLDDYERMNIADALLSKNYANGELIIKQGDEANGMYILEGGKVSVVARSTNGEEKTVNEIDEGGYFGELGLINRAPRAASILALKDVKVAFLDKSAFERLLGPCMAMMMERVPEMEKQLADAFGAKVNIGTLNSNS